MEEESDSQLQDFIYKLKSIKALNSQDIIINNSNETLDDFLTVLKIDNRDNKDLPEKITEDLCPKIQKMFEDLQDKETELHQLKNVLANLVNPDKSLKFVRNKEFNL